MGPFTSSLLPRQTRRQNLTPTSRQRPNHSHDTDERVAHTTDLVLGNPITTANTHDDGFYFLLD